MAGRGRGVSAGVRGRVFRASPSQNPPQIFPCFFSFSPSRRSQNPPFSLSAYALLQPSSAESVTASWRRTHRAEPPPSPPRTRAPELDFRGGGKKVRPQAMSSEGRSRDLTVLSGPGNVSFAEMGSFGPKLRKDVREAVPLAALTLGTMYVESMAIEMGFQDE